MPVDPAVPIRVTAFDWVPDFARGLVRDLRVRWALEEAGRDYAVQKLAQGSQKEPPHRALQPFGQVPTYEEGDLVLFESGAIVLHVAEVHGGNLLPPDRARRARATEWMFAALNTVEPPIIDHAIATLFEADKPWSRPRLPAIRARIDGRLADLSRRLEDADWLDGEFSAGDLLMVSVLRIIAPTDMLAPYPNLSAYVARGEARPAFQRALAAQLADFTGAPPPEFAAWARAREAQNEKQGETA